MGKLQFRNCSGKSRNHLCETLEAENNSASKNRANRRWKISEKCLKYNSLKKEKEREREREREKEGWKDEEARDKQGRSFKLFDFVPARRFIRRHRRGGTRWTTKCRACAWLHGETRRPSRGKRKDSGESFRRDKLAWKRICRGRDVSS